MKNVKTLLIFITISAFMFASQTRVDALGGAGFWADDYSNIGAFPASINNHQVAWTDGSDFTSVWNADGTTWGFAGGTGDDMANVWWGNGNMGVNFGLGMTPAKTIADDGMDADAELTWTNMGMSIVNLTDTLPLEVSLESAYPNPFNPTTTLSFVVPSDMNVTLSIYDMRGRLVDELVNDLHKRGNHQVVWNADQYSSGVYMVKLITGSTMQVQKVMLVK